MDYNEDILNEVEEGDDWSEEEPTEGAEETDSPTEESDEDWTGEDEDM